MDPWLVLCAFMVEVLKSVLVGDVRACKPSGAAKTNKQTKNKRSRQPFFWSFAWQCLINRLLLSTVWVSQVAQWYRISLPSRRCRFDSLIGNPPLEKGMAPHSNLLAWKSPWMEEPGGLQVHGVPKSWSQLSDYITKAQVAVSSHLMLGGGGVSTH